MTGKDRVQEIVTKMFVCYGEMIDFLDEVEGLSPPKDSTAEMIALLAPDLIKEMREVASAQSNLAETIENHCGIDAYDAAQEEIVSDNDTAIRFSAKAVAPGATATIDTTPTCLFQGQKLVVRRGLADFDIVGLVVDGVERMPSGSIAALCFAHDVLGNGLVLPWTQGLMQLRVKNTSTAPADFDANLLGRKVA